MPTFWENKKVLVTGGAGLLGSYLVEDLVEAGASVTVLDNLTTGFESNLSTVLDRVRLVVADIRHESTVKECVQDADIVYHLAAHMLVRRAVESPQVDYAVNMGGSWNVLNAARVFKVQKFVFASSCGVYGRSGGYSLSEDRAAPNNPYGAAKLAIEHFGNSYHACYGLPFVGIRLFSLLGPRMRQTVIYDLLKRLHENPKQLTVYGTNRVVRDFTPVRSAAYVMKRAAEIPSMEGHVYNYSGRLTFSIPDVVGFLLDILGLVGKTEVVLTGSSWQGDMDRLCADVTRLNSVMDLPTIGFKEEKWKVLRRILTEYVRWLSERTGWNLFSLKDSF